jgi:hypothetical protein
VGGGGGGAHAGAQAVVSIGRDLAGPSMDDDHVA